MLQIFAVEQGLEDIPMEAVDLSETAQQAANAFCVLFAKKQFQVEVKLQTACMINGNAENIWRAMNNFLMNAWRYAPANSQIRIKTEKVNEDAVFTVYNDGMPINETDREKIWDSFYQGNNSAPDFRQDWTGIVYCKKHCFTARRFVQCGKQRKWCGIRISDSAEQE